MTGEVARTFKQQRLFIANASHELRTPLANIQIRSDALLRNNNDPAITTRYLAEISAETERMGKLTFDLLDLARLESINEDENLHSRKVTPVDILPHLYRLCETMELRAKLANVKLTHLLPAALPAFCLQISDLETIVRNLLDNAIKYTPAEGTVTLSATMILPICESAGNQVYQIRVEDSGIGIPREDLPYIFDRFYRVDKARTPRANAQKSIGTGAGLGLALVHAVVHAYHGQVFVESVQGQGSVFTVQIPIG